MSAGENAHVEVRVNGKILDDFESGTISLSMADAVNHFELTYIADPEPGQRAVFRGDFVEVLIDADEGKGPESVIEGYVGAVNDRDTEEYLELRFSGQSTTRDMAQASAVNKPGHWTNATLDRILSDLAQPFSIEAIVDGDVGAPFESFSTQKDETVVDAIQRACMARGKFCYSVGGGIVAARAGKYSTQTVLERGVNVREWEREDTDYNRYSEYRIRGQARPHDGNWGAASSQLQDVVRDEGITRYRPLYLHVHAHDGLDMRARAELERNQRAGQGETLTAYVDDWATVEGHAWRPNMLTRARNSVLGVNAGLLVVTARFRFGPNEPREVQLEMARPEAYDLAKYPALKRGESWTS